ncbi:double-strand break repair protein Mre11p [Trichomonascus vanleenenianus]|uniref:MRX complex nuclease subunit n=1 Tax=Trichomonascus vanleenenianus TaxID=2268995 RepID=UPI003ECAACBA
MAEYGPDTIRILVTTDNHVGYNEGDAIRGTDAAITFEEIMELAREQEVDMILQGGDLFHISKPSKQSMYNVIKSLRRNCLGDKPCEMEMLNHGLLDMDDEDFDHVNYEDHNLNIAIPLFGISGNHDDAGGTSMLSAMDVLAATGLVNHFGRVLNNDKIDVTPVLLRKGSTRLALYGLASVRDERLFRTFAAGNVKFLRPNDGSEWYNLLAVHQNHTAHTEKGYLPEAMLPGFLDMVIWGHEHECLIDPVTNPHKGFQVIQPGSSVATSLIEAESKTKHVCILNVTGKSCVVEKFLLKTVRPFALQTVHLATEPDLLGKKGPDHKNDIIKFMDTKVDQMINEAVAAWIDQQGPDFEMPEDGPPLPLVRLKVDYSGGYEVENPTRFSNRYRGRVANTNDVVQYVRKKDASGGGGGRKRDEIGEVIDALAIADTLTLDQNHVQKFVEEYLKSQKGLDVLLEKGLGEAVAEFVDKDDKSALRTFIDGSLTVQLENLLKTNVMEDDEKQVVRAMMEGKALLSALKPAAIRSMTPAIRSTTPTTTNATPTVVCSDNDEDEEFTTTTTSTTTKKAARAKTTTTTRGRGRGRGHGARSTTTTGTTRTSTRKKNPPKSAEIVSDSDPEVDLVSQIRDSASDDDVIMVSETRRKSPSPKPQPKAKPKPPKKKPAKPTKPAPTRSARSNQPVHYYNESEEDEDHGFA